MTNMLCGTGSKKKHNDDKEPLNKGECEEGVSSSMGTVRDLRDFLVDAELEHYYGAIKNELKIASVPQIKYVAEEDLVNIGMTKPEMRRLKKFYKKECPSGKFDKFKRALMDKANLSPTSHRTLSPSPPDKRISRPISYIRPTGKQIISSDSIEVDKTLGEGEFGVVQQGTWQTETGEKVEVAIKCLSRERLENGTQEFLKEAGLMQTVDHENIVRMYGVVLDKENALMLVTELAPQRSLLECLKDPLLRQQEFTLPRLCDCAQQVCDGMSYLESKRLIHRDLAARNILVFSKNIVKISDFGLSRALGRGKDYYQSNFSINLKLPIAWCAPECINYLKFTSASDVWAYGVTLWELFTYGQQPWSGLSGQKILDAIDSPANQRLNQPELCPRNYYDLMLQCWDADPENRPCFSEMFIQLPQMRPTQVKAIKDFPEITVPKEYIYYRAYDVIVVLDKSPSDAPCKGLWKGVMMNGKTGFFDPCNTVPFVEPKSSPNTPTNKKITRKDSKRSASKKLRTDMISRPQNDLRHTGHIGYDGAVFGDVGFIGENFDKLPVKTASIGKLDDSRNSINLSRMSDSPDRGMPLSLSDSSLNGGPAHKTNGYGNSWISVESLESHGTFRGDEHDDHNDTGYQDIDDDSLLSDFKMPDLGTSFDFGGSFMDEVLRALNEKESQIEAKADRGSSPASKEDSFRSPSQDRSRSLSPPKELRSPPPLPTQPPRVAPRRTICNKETTLSPKPEPNKKQAKVKPMSTSEEKMMDEAINMANELVSHNGRAQMLLRQESLNSEKHSEDESGSESPRLLSKLKASIKRSPKRERKRTFSDSLNHENIQDDVPPEAQEAYNLLVVQGPSKDGSSSTNTGYQKQTVLDQYKRESSSSNGSCGHNFAFADSSSSSISRTPDRSSPIKSISRQSSERGSVSPPNFGRLQSELAPERPVPRPRADAPTPPRRGEVPTPKPRPEMIQRVEPTLRPLPPPVPQKSAYIKQDISEANAFDNPLVINEDHWRGSGDTYKTDTLESQTHQEILRVELPPEEKFDQLNTSSDSGRKSTSPSDESQSSSSKFSFFDEEVADPSPREIMSKLARESRLRRSIDHQRAMSGEAEPSTPNRNLREPAGIPGKKFSFSKDKDDKNEEEEVETNPLRMLRGGVIPVRGGRAGSGMSTNKPTLRHPKLSFTTSASSSLQHSVSVDAGRDRNTTQSLSMDAERCDSSDIGSVPAVPPRSFSICDNYNNIVNNNNPLPLPPRNPRRAVSLNAKPRERKYPLNVNNNRNASLTSDLADNDVSVSASVIQEIIDSSSSVNYSSIQISDSVSSPNTIHGPTYQTNTNLHHNSNLEDSRPFKSTVVTKTSISALNCNSSLNQPSPVLKDKYFKPFPIPDHINVTAKPLHEADSSSLADLPPAPPPPTYKKQEIIENDADSDDNVFDSPFSSSKQLNLSSEGGSSGASTFPRGFKLFGIKNVQFNLEQVGFYNHLDPFWVKSVIISDKRSHSEKSEGQEALDASPLMLANYKCTEGVSYEDLLDFALDREKNGEEITLMQKLFGSDVTREDCLEALTDTKWDLHRAIKFIKLKQLLSIQLGDVSRCKEALLACDWNIQKAADYMLGVTDSHTGRRTPPSPECVDV